MNETRNRRLYRLWAPVYDGLFERISASGRCRAVSLLAARSGERILLPGVGTGLDLPLLPGGALITGIDLSPAMLGVARRRAAGRAIVLTIMDAQRLEFRDATFDAVLLNLILSVAPDGRAVFREAWRVLCPGGRMVIFDKFLPEGATLTRRRRLLGAVISRLGTDPNRRLSEIIGSDLLGCIDHDKPSLLRGQYRLVRLRKPRTAAPGLASGPEAPASALFDGSYGLL